jgi:protein AaeX
VKFVEIDILGVYIAPISLLIVAAWFVTLAARWFASRFGLLSQVWHPALFVFAVYIIVLSSMVLVVVSALSITHSGEAARTGPRRSVCPQGPRPAPDVISAVGTFAT